MLFDISGVEETSCNTHKRCILLHFQNRRAEKYWCSTIYPFCILFGCFITTACKIHNTDIYIYFFFSEVNNFTDITFSMN